MSKEREKLALPAGTVVDGYRLSQVQTAWGFYLTYAAEEIATGRRVLVHELLPEELVTRAADGTIEARVEGAEESVAWVRNRFAMEGRELAACAHPGVEKILAVLAANGTAYWVTPPEEGRSLKRWLDDLGRAPNEAELRALLVPLLAALQRIHAAGLRHLNLKLETIRIAPDKKPVLVHFAGARQAIARRSHEAGAATTGYSPIEQYELDKTEGPWTDIYSLAAVLHRAITGQVPPEATLRLKSDPYQRLTGRYADRYSDSFLAAIDGALAPDANARPQSIEGWRRMLGISEGAGTAQAARRNRLPIVAVAVSAVLLLSAVAWHFLQPPPVPPLDDPDKKKIALEEEQKKEAEKKRAEEEKRKAEEKKKEDEAKLAEEKKKKEEEEKLPEERKKAEEERVGAEKEARERGEGEKQAEAEAARKEAGAKAAEEKAAAARAAAEKAAKAADETKAAPKKKTAEKAAEDAAEKAKEAQSEADRAAAEKGAADVAAKKAGLDKATAERVAAEKAVAQKTIEGKLAALAVKRKSAEEKAAPDQAAAEAAKAGKADAEAAAQRVGEEKVAAEQLVKEKSAAEKAAAEKLAKAIADQKTADGKTNPPKSPDEKTEEKKTPTEKAAEEKKEAEEKRAEEEKKAAEAKKAAEEKKEADKKAAAEEKAAAEKAAAEKKAADEKAAAEKAAAEKEKNNGQNGGPPAPPSGGNGGQVGSGLGGIWETKDKDSSGHPLKRLVIYADTHYELTTGEGIDTGIIRAKLGVISLDSEKTSASAVSTFKYKSMSIIDTDGALGKMEWIRVSADAPERATDGKK